MNISACLRASLLSVFSMAVMSSLAAQSALPRPENRIAPGADMTPKTRLTGNLPRWANSEADAGAVPDATPLHITLMLSRSAEQEAAFTQLLADQQNPSSPRYHQWLTPAQIGEQFGPTTDDVNVVTQWLTAHDMQVTSVSPSRIFVEVSSTTGIAGAALSTTFHNFMLDGTPRLSAITEPAIPTALAVVVSLISGLMDAPERPLHTISRAEPRTTNDGSHPMASGPGNTLHYVYPGDFNKIYDVNAIIGAGFTGAGFKVAIIGRSQISSTDITELEQIAGLPSKIQNTIVVPGSPDPGQVKGEDQGEATLDVGRVLTTAPGAQADLLIATTASGGITTAMQYNVQTLLDPVMTISFGLCEKNAGSAYISSADALFKQAAAEGISTFVSSGDSGAAGCSPANTTPTGSETPGINALCSSSYVTCVGGTEFNDTSAPALYWSATNSPTLTSALGYIPEGAWNEPSVQKTSGGVTTTGYVISATGGGLSLFIPKPSWQVGTGVPADNARDVPDISFTAALHDGYFSCLAFMGSGFDCNLGGGIIFGGTSAAAPGMAAVAAILDQKAGKAQGNLNPVLYALAASTPAAFHDATPASSGVSGCPVTVANICNNSIPSPTSLSTGLPGFQLQAGYDLATGLGSLDVTNFILAASTAQLGSTTTVTAQPTTIIVGNTAVFTATVAATGLTPISGTVQFYSNGSVLGTPVTIVNGTASTPATAFTAAGTYAITATYSGNVTYATSTSPALSFVVSAVAPVGLAVSASPTTLTVSAGATTGNTSNVAVVTTGAYNGTVALTCAVSYSSGTATYPPTCSFAQTSLTFTGGLSSSTVLTVATTLPHAIPGTGTSAHSKTPFAPLGGMAFAALLLVLLPKRRKNMGQLAMLPLVLMGTAMMAMSGCGSGGSPTAASTPVGTSKGTYTVSVTATPTSGPAATTTLTLTVQ